MRRKIVVVVVSVAVVGALYFFNADHLPPRTPVKVARVVSGLAIPSSARVLAYESEWQSFNGDGFTQVKLKLTPGEFARLAREAPRAGYKSLPATPAADARVYSHTSKNTRGWYRIVVEEDSLSYSLAVLSSVDGSLSAVTIVQ
jgi:hypothetical protein